MALAYAVENEPLGTAGALKNAECFVHHGPFLVLNGDSILDLALGDIVDFHRAQGALVTLALCRVPSSSRYGSVQTGPNGRVIGFFEKGDSAGPDAAGADRVSLINGGVYVCSRAVFQAIPAAPPQTSLEREIFPGLIGRGLYAFPSDGYFIDIGVPEDCERAQQELPERFSSC
jgi:NDP-sugar pyrophosphorylase family protein